MTCTSLFLTAFLLRTHICVHKTRLYTTLSNRHRIKPLWSSGNRGGPNFEMQGFKPDSTTIESSYWSSVRRPAPSFYGQVATAPCIVELSQHAWRGTFLAVATAVAPRWRRTGYQTKALDLLHRSATRDWRRGAIKAFRLATLAAAPLNFVKFNGS